MTTMNTVAKKRGRPKRQNKVESVGAKGASFGRDRPNGLNVNVCVLCERDTREDSHAHTRGTFSGHAETICCACAKKEDKHFRCLIG